MTRKQTRTIVANDQPPQVVSLTYRLDELGVSLRQEGVTLNEWMDRGREIRDALLKEKYGSGPKEECS